MVDVYVVVDVDALVRYPLQLHALANIPVYINRWQIVKCMDCLISPVLIVRDSRLASLVGSQTEQAWRSVCWLALYFLILAASCFDFSGTQICSSAIFSPR